MKDFEPLIGEWHGEGEIPMEPPMKVSVEAKVRRLGAFIVFSSVGEPAQVPDSVSIIGGAAEGEPQPMHYFDDRGVKRLYMMALDGSIWTIWRAPGEDWNGPHGPGFNQRFIGEISADGKAIAGRWERGMGRPAMSGRSTSRSATSASSAPRSLERQSLPAVAADLATSLASAVETSKTVEPLQELR
jgi:hypothetical protein